MTRIHVQLSLTFAIVTVLVAWPLAAEPPVYVAYGGVYDTAEGMSTQELGFEVRRPGPWGVRRLSWIGGAAASTDQAVWIYAGALYEFELGKGVRLGPGFAVSLWEGGDGKDLGGPIEFRSSLELSMRASSGSRIGLLVYHLSNNDYYDRNPGSNSLVVTWTFRRRHPST